MKLNDLHLLCFHWLANTMKYKGGFLYNLVFTEWRHSVSQNRRLKSFFILNTRHHHYGLWLTHSLRRWPSIKSISLQRFLVCCVCSELYHKCTRKILERFGPLHMHIHDITKKTMGLLSLNFELLVSNHYFLGTITAVFTKKLSV